MVAIAAIALLVVCAVLWQLDAFRAHRSWIVATGHTRGTYFKVGKKLVSITNDLAPWESFEVVQTEGSSDNIARIRSNTAHFALVQTDAEPAPNARLIATLYDELLHIAVRADLRDRVNGLEDLSQLSSVSLGTEGSGTRNAAEMLLQHFEVTLEEGAKLAVESYDLRSRFEADEHGARLDAAFMLAGPGSDLAQHLFDSPHVKLLSLGDGPPGEGQADAFAMLNPAFRARLIPAQLYGKQPTDTVHTVGVTALLIASSTVDNDVVREVTARLFRHRNELAAVTGTPLCLSESGSGRETVFPLHEGAESYYRREQPFFLVEYAEVVSLFITMAVGIWTITKLFLRWTEDRKKDRIDDYYASISQSSSLPREERLAELRGIHQRAFKELMAERLAANESFIIFHDYLLSEIASAERDDDKSAS
jgi:TRAP transporter TAXI family solute receptor